MEYSSLREKIATESKARKSRYAEYEALYANAREAGLAAGNAAAPTPMVVGEPSTPFGTNIDYSKKFYYVPEGACGFAWIKVRPGNSSFAKWLVKSNNGRSAYSGGVDIWVSDFGQSVARKEAYAYAFAKVLKDAGITAYADSRLD